MLLGKHRPGTSPSSLVKPFTSALIACGNGKAGIARLPVTIEMVLLHRYGFDRTLLGAVATADALLHVDDRAHVVREVQDLVLADIYAQAATGTLVSINGWSLVALFSHVSPPDAEINS